MQHHEAKIEALRGGLKGQTLVGHRLVVSPGGRKNTYTFEAERLGSARESRDAAMRKAKELGVKVIRPGGRKTRDWGDGTRGVHLLYGGKKLVVVCKLPDEEGEGRSKRWFSVRKHGVEGTIQEVIKVRSARGMAKPDKAWIEQFTSRVQTAFHGESTVLIGGRGVRGEKTRLVLEAVRNGHHTLSDIAASCEMTYRATNAYVASLEKQGKVRATNPRAVRGSQSFVATVLGSQ